MTTHFYVKQVKKPCMACKGKGSIEHPAWMEYREKNRGKPAQTEEEMRRWFLNHGWYQESSIYGASLLPDKEIHCSACNGRGETITEIELSAAIKAYEEMGKCAADIGDFECTCGWH